MFFLSLFSVVVSSYFLSSLFLKRILEKHIFPIIFLLIAFSQLVLSFELLSLLSQIGALQLLVVNIFFLVLSCFLWCVNGKPLCKFELKDEAKKIFNALKLDKILFVLFVFFLFFILIGLFNSIFLPISFGDALIYYFTRVTTWIQNGNINHFITPDHREIIMPVNMEFLYTWIFLFFKKEAGVSFFSYISFINILYVVYHLLSLFKVSVRKRIWSIIVFSSFAIIGHMISVPCADIFIGALLLSGLYLFFLYAKNNSLIVLYFSSLATALAFGSKTTAIMAYPSIVFLMIAFLVLYKFGLKKKTIVYYSLFLILNFLVFSSYNYILNFIQFANPITSRESYLINQPSGGIKCYLYNLINYFYMFFDFSGIQNVDLYNNIVTFLREKTYILFGIPKYSCCSKLFDCVFKFNSEMSMTKSFLGAFGLFLFIPSVGVSLIRGINLKSFFCSVNRLYLSLFTIAFIFNILLFSKVMIFTSTNSRYLVTFVCLAAPIIVFSYIKSNKNIFKWLLLYFFFIYLILIPFSKIKSTITDYFYLKKTYPQVAKTYELLTHRFNDENVVYGYLAREKNLKIALIAYQNESRLFDIEKLKFNGHRIDKFLIENIDEYDLSDYDYIVANSYKLDSKTILRKKSDEQRKYVPKCVYYKQNYVVSDYKNPDLIMVCCDVPFDYFSSIGFEKCTDINLRLYVVLKNKNKK